MDTVDLEMSIFLTEVMMMILEKLRLMHPNLTVSLILMSSLIGYHENTSSKILSTHQSHGHKNRMFEQLTNLKQYNLYVSDYVNRYRELMEYCELVEKTRLTNIRFREELRDDIKFQFFSS